MLRLLPFLKNLRYKVRCFFRPYNVVTARSLPRTYVDRDELMFHCIFQILVDFVELEQPFIAWGSDQPRPKRHTNRAEMHAFIDKYYSTPRVLEGMHPEDIKLEIKSAESGAKINKEILHLYEWYKDGKWEFDFRKYYDATGETHEFVDLPPTEDGLKRSTIERVSTGKPKLITWGEFHQIEQDHNTMCEVALNRVLEIRTSLWT